MRVAISQPVTGMKYEKVIKERDWITHISGKQCLEGGYKKLFPYGLLKKIHLNPHVISTFINNDRYCVKGRFTYVADSGELISNSISVKEGAIGKEREWIFRWGEKSGKVNPFDECIIAKDKSRYVNQASCIFLQMRDALSQGLLKIAYIGQLDEVEYLLDRLGRYEVVNFNKLPIATSYAIACSAIF